VVAGYHVNAAQFDLKDAEKDYKFGFEWQFSDVPAASPGQVRLLPWENYLLLLVFRSRDCLEVRLWTLVEETTQMLNAICGHCSTIVGGNCRKIRIRG
jgi:hypothetical protein